MTDQVGLNPPNPTLPPVKRGREKTDNRQQSRLWDLFRAEVRKILGNRWIAALLIWLWPVGGVVLPIILLMVALLSSSEVMKDAPVFRYQWNEIALGAWLLPSNLIGRLLIICLGVAVFAGEYGWGTWKVIVPRADRARLVLAKYLAFAVLLILGFVGLSALLPVGVGIVQAVRGLPYGPEPTAEIVQKFAQDYAILVVLTFFNVLVSVGFAGVASSITRAPIGGIIGAFMLLFADSGFTVGVTLLAYLFQSPSIASLARLTSGLNIPNISSLVMYNQPAVELIQGAGTNSIEASFAVLAVWAVILVAAHLVVFQRQDLV